jgi:hypothetical protein
MAAMPPACAVAASLPDSCRSLLPSLLLGRLLLPPLLPRLLLPALSVRPPAAALLLRLLLLTLWG